jgi:hypothetical protein
MRITFHFTVHSFTSTAKEREKTESGSYFDIKPEGSGLDFL